ncbi:transposase [Streptomyces sp. NPDC002588]|uniref:transposase n=1 Tax=Streptomyces sp. NPDC002588 TaxID=3154419 RepID=UPI00332498D8
MQAKPVLADHTLALELEHVTRPGRNTKLLGQFPRSSLLVGVKGTVNEFAHGHGMRHCRYRGQRKAHIQHVLTAIAVNIERLSGLPLAEETPTPRRPTAFQNYLDQREIHRLKSWRTLGSCLFLRPT